VDDGIPLLRACLRETRALRTQPRHARPRRLARRPRHVRRAGPSRSALLIALGAALVVTSLPATVRGLQPVAVADAQPLPVVADLPAPVAPAAAVRSPQPTAPATPAPAAPTRAARVAPTPPAVAPRPGRPVRVRIPAVGIDAPVSGLGLKRDGAMRVPRSPDTVAWYKRGPRPGAHGPALLVGHVDSTKGPGAFFGLRRVTPGDLIHVRDERGRTRTFVVDQISRHRKTRFPTSTVFGGVDGPELRLVTCSGSFNRVTRHYSHNLVVFARLATGAGA
jgi:hypothetical protein